MNMQNVYEYLCENIPSLDIKQNEDMSKHTTFKVGGKADIFVKVRKIEELESLLKYIKENDIPFYIIGNGSNILVKDKGIRGIVIKLEFDEIKIQEKEDRVILNIGTGVKLGMLAGVLQKKGIAGFEFASRNSWYYRWSNIYECRGIWKRNEGNIKRGNLH